MGSMSIVHWVIVLVVVLVLFGTKKIRNIGPDLGNAIRGFKEGLKGEEDKTAQAADKPAIDVEAKEKPKS